MRKKSKENSRKKKEPHLDIADATAALVGRRRLELDITVTAGNDKSLRRNGR